MTALASFLSAAESRHQVAAIVMTFICLSMGGFRAVAQVEFPPSPPDQAVTLSAGSVQRWQEGEQDIYALHENCEIRQNGQTIRAPSAIVWIRQSSVFSLTPHELTVYAEEVSVTQAAAVEQSSADSAMRADSWTTRLSTYQPIRFGFALPVPSTAPPKSELFERAQRALSTAPGLVAPAQFSGPLGPPDRLPFVGNLDRSGPSPAFGSNLPPAFVPGVSPPAAPKRMQVFPRSSNVRINSDSFLSPDGRERITVVDSGVNIIIQGVSSLGTVDIATDRLVVWSPEQGGGFSLDETSEGASESSGVGLELYMEGNIVFRQADRVIYARSMYYNVQQERGVVLQAELLTGAPSYDGVVRLRADVLRQLNRTQFQAHQSAITTSRLGVPRYWFQSGDLLFEDRQQPVVDPFTGAPLIDPATGQQAVQGERLVTSRNNLIYVGETPIFYWPTFSTNLTTPTTYINRVRFNTDRVFGTQVGVGVNLNQLFNLGNQLPGTQWSGSLDYLSDRGVGFGTTLEYVLPEFIGLPGETRGFLDAWGINDSGLDNLGADRRALVPEEDFRGRILWQHRQRMVNGLQITGEFGLISDRNFLEQYYEREWDQWKDQSTAAELKYLTETGSWNLSGAIRLNEFFTETQWLPRFDQFELGRALIQDRVTWFGHSHLGYGELQRANAPLDPADLASFNRLAWEVESEGIRTGARHELDLPFQLAAVKVVPYALGEVMHWGEDITGQSNTRLLGQLGVRTSVPMWSVDPTLRNDLFNLNGLAHKVVFESEFLWADANRNLDEFPLYDQLDDNSQEHFRRRFPDSTFGGLPFVNDLVPIQFDERYYALRYGLQSQVTSPSAEIADDLMLLRTGIRQRWQTRRGLPGSQRIVDWMSLDVEGSFFPEANRDNFGEHFGLLTYDWRWHVGDRVTLMSDGYVDTFIDGLRVFTVGGYLSRPSRGSTYLGYRSITGPLNSDVINAAINYRLSHKWIGSAGIAIDLRPTGNNRQRFGFTRVGESFFISAGVNYDASRNNIGFGFSIEPRFLPASYRGELGGVPIPAVGAFGLE